MMVTQLRTVTAGELLAMPRGGVRRELVRGEVRERPLAGYPEGRVAGCILRLLTDAVEARGLGVVVVSAGFQLESEPDTVRAPTLSFVRRERLDPMDGDEDGYFPGSPDLAIYVVSPTDGYSAVSERVGGLLDAGTSTVLIVDPANRHVAVHRSRREITVLSEDDVLDGGDVVPGWSIPVRDVFA